MKLTPAKLVLASLGAALLAGATLLAEPPGFSHKGGTDILHFLLREAMHNTGVQTSASGHVKVNQDEQGRADHQSLVLFLRGLDPNAPYLLLAASTADTNSDVVSEFDTDAHGRAFLFYRQTGGGGSHEGGLGHGKYSLPAALTPVSGILDLAIANASTQAVLTADLQMPDRLVYLLKRTLINGNVDASLRIKASNKETDIRLFAKGLNPNMDYFLAFNGGIAQTNRTDARGRLAAGAQFLNPFDILDTSSVALWDNQSNVVVSTQLP